MAGGGGSESGERKLDQTPTWAVAGVCAVIILISFVLEKGLHRVGTVSISLLFQLRDLQSVSLLIVYGLYCCFDYVFT